MAAAENVLRFVQANSFLFDQMEELKYQHQTVENRTDCF